MNRRKPPNKYLFGRKSPIDSRPVFVAVEAYDKDHAIARLLEKFPYVEKMDWDHIEDLDPDHFLGGMGEDLPLLEKTPIATFFAPFFSRKIH